MLPLTIYSYTAGICHTIKSTDITLEHGKPYSLAAVLYLDDFENLLYLLVSEYKMTIHRTFAAGAALFVHQPNTLPLLSDATTLSPGHHASIQVTNHVHMMKRV